MHPLEDPGAVDPLVGAELAGRFRVLSRLGTGAMGAVYRAEQLAVGRTVALKVMRPEVAADPRMVARFHREARAASRIQSPNVVTLFDFGESDGHLFIAMELLDGESLGTRIHRESRLEPREAVRLATGIANALQSAHDAGVVHRDLKPDNIVLSRRGELKVLDFGIARMLEDHVERDDLAPLTQVGMIVGTPLYMSPEAASRRPVGPSADLYALGVILFEMLVGRPPFEDDQPVLLLGMHLRVPPERLREALPGLVVPAELEDLVDALLAKQPSHRPASAAEVARRLEAINRSFPATSQSGPIDGTDVGGAPAPTASAASSGVRDIGARPQEPSAVVSASALAAPVAVTQLAPTPDAVPDLRGPAPRSIANGARWLIVVVVMTLVVFGLGAFVLVTRQNAVGPGSVRRSAPARPATSDEPPPTSAPTAEALPSHGGGPSVAPPASTAVLSSVGDASAERGVRVDGARPRARSVAPSRQPAAPNGAAPRSAGSTTVATPPSLPTPVRARPPVDAVTRPSQRRTGAAPIREYPE